MLEKIHALYICYFGLREPLVQTQVLPYLREIQKDGIKFSLLTFEPDFNNKWNLEQIAQERGKLLQEGIVWYCLPYHKRPSVPATLYDIFNGAYFSIRLARQGKIDVFHARSSVPALMGAIAKIFSGGKLIFDIRGFFSEEYTDAGIWKENGLIYRSTKRIEKWLLRKSDGFVVLTEKAREILFPESKKTGYDKFGRPVEVIPCCIDPKRFDAANNLNRENIRSEMNLTGRRVYVYVGSLGGWYLTDEIAHFFSRSYQQNSDTFVLILTQSDPELIKQKLIKKGIPESDFLIKKVSPFDVPKYLKAADVAVSFIKACYSKQSSSPTKIAEYLASGLPIVSNSGIGDLDALIKDDKVGIILKGFDEEDYTETLINLDSFLTAENLSSRCRQVAYQKFDLQQVGGKHYRRLYEKLLSKK